MNTRKFTFDTEFRPEGDLVSNAARARQRKLVSHEEIDALCGKARAEGIKAGQVRATEALAAAAADAAVALRDLLAQSRADVEALRAEAAQLALAAARTLAGFALAAAPEAEVEAALRASLHQAIGEPRVTLRAAPAVIEALNGRVAEIAHEEGYDGRVQISADPAMTGADCRIEWRGGGAERSQNALDSAISQLVARRFSLAPSTED